MNSKAPAARVRRPLLLSVSVAALAMGCGAADADRGAEDVPTTATTTTITTTPATSAHEPPDDGDLPGERLDTFPFEGAELAVVGVAADDVLNVRSGPGIDFDVVTELDPVATNLLATGHNRSLDDAGLWAEVTANGQTGWVNTAYLGHLGVADDITAQIAPTPNEMPRAETMLALIDLVTGPYAQGETPDHELDVVIVHGPTTGDPSEVIVDILGYRDDSGLGQRLHLFAEPDPDAEGFMLRHVESTSLCRRGASDEGLCL